MARASSETLMTQANRSFVSPVVVAEFSSASAGRLGAAAAATSSPSPNGAGSGRAGAAAPDSSSRLAAEPPPSPVRWRIYADGSVGRATGPAAAPWQPVPLTPGLHITNGSAPSALVCWLVGRGGVVLRTTDGITFTSITAPAAVDFTSVVAASATSATVSAADGRTFTTSDAGLTWR
jgi:hypothetical protein